MNNSNKLEQNPMNSPLFITARFRTGSTMLWNLFRQLHEVRAYYEPLHDWLTSYLKYDIEPQKSHLFVKSYFDEYKNAPKAISLHRSDFANNRLYLGNDEKYPELYTYIQALVESVPNWQTAVLQFNRIDFRLAWIKTNFPKARLLHLTRNPRDQWYSTLAPFNIDIDNSIDLDAYDLVTWARDLYKQFPFLATPQIEHAYQRFYYLWKLSYLAGQRLSNLSVAYEDILLEPQKYLTQILQITNLYSAENLETCLKVVEPKPEHAWNKDRGNGWFSEMEQKCEAVLDELGLNEHFALIPLVEIQERSPKYQALINNPGNDLWVTASFKRTIITDRLAGFEINRNLDQIYKNALYNRDMIQVELDEVKAEREQIQAHRDRVQAELDEVKAEREQIRAHRDRVQAELEHVYHSRSYRITAPLRAVFGIARIWRDRLRQSKNRSAVNPVPAVNQANNTVRVEDSPLMAVQYRQQVENAQDVNLDEIMEKIRAEVSRRKGQTLRQNGSAHNSPENDPAFHPLSGSNFVSLDAQETGFFRFIKKAQILLQKTPFYKPVYSIALKFKRHIPKYQRQPLAAADLLEFDDEDFIRNAYKAILKRGPDSEGFDNFLSKLRSGSISKAEILGRLRYSAEGRRSGVKIKGLFARYLAGAILGK